MPGLSWFLVLTFSIPARHLASNPKCLKDKIYSFDLLLIELTNESDKSKQM